MPVLLRGEKIEHLELEVLEVKIVLGGFILFVSI
jgi:hypothetical protein